MMENNIKFRVYSPKFEQYSRRFVEVSMNRGLFSSDDSRNERLKWYLITHKINHDLGLNGGLFKFRVDEVRSDFNDGQLRIEEVALLKESNQESILSAEGSKSVTKDRVPRSGAAGEIGFTEEVETFSPDGQKLS